MLSGTEETMLQLEGSIAHDGYAYVTLERKPRLIIKDGAISNDDTPLRVKLTAAWD